ncbi:two-component system response regulator YesN [Paenibacillus taihuensis]|uniref:Two-component system response regulator YesN n=1 Tax=Paenibacillus taihuensis TaxID=1156355 RepID=A0A3D9QW69_9BACL|nr:response regulator [Paenibacillus taihuensis]REE69647.1 two-component system response regulator YesN [Paenibacillus taihuensis]
MIKLLLVEDESVTRKGLMKHIKWHELGVDVVEEAKDGVDGLDAARRILPDIVISDIRMPGMNGIEFTSCIREQFPACQIIYLSGHSDKEYLKAAIRLNAVSYVEKPINIEELQEVIAKAVQLCLENHKFNHINLALSESIPFIRQNIVNGLIHNPIDCAELHRNLHLAGIAFDQCDSYTVSIIVPAYDDAVTNEDKQSCSNRIIEFLDQASNGFTHLAVTKESFHILILSAHKPAYKQDFAAMYHLLSAHVKEHQLRCSEISWVVGSTSSELSGIRSSYEMANGFLKHLFYYDFGNMFYANNKPAAVYALNEEILTSYARLLQELHKDSIIQFTEHLYHMIKTKTGTPVDEVKNLFYRMMRMLIQQGEKHGLQLSSSNHRQEEYDWAMMSKIGTLKQLKDYYLKKVSYIIDGIDNIHSNSRAVLDAKKYIRSHYRDKEISVNMLADHVHLTPTYLSSLFKKETGKTISEYITEVRIERSADLLMEPQAKLYEVADLSGYNDANYFAKTFKKITGMTPTEFRRKHKS